MCVEDKPSGGVMGTREIRSRGGYRFKSPERQGPLIAGCMAALALVWAMPVMAQQAAPYSRQAKKQQNSFMIRSTMTGDWGGVRSRLKHEGVDLHAGYDGEYARTLSGGMSGGGDDAYAQQVSFGAGFDMAKLAGWRGASFHLQLNYRQGHDLAGESIGGRHTSVQEAYGAGENFRMVELSYSQVLAGGALETQIGFYPLGNEFAHFAPLCKFQSGTACGHLKNLPSSSGWNDYPTGQWGGRLQWNISDHAYAEIGVFEVNPTYGTSNHGFKMDFQGATGAIIPVEFSYKTDFDSGTLPGRYKIGGYYDTSNAPDVVHSAQTHSSRYGGYVLASQMLLSFDGTSTRGLEVFGGAGVSDTNTAVFSNTEVAGVIVKGPLAARPHDFISLGYFREGVNHRKVGAEEALRAQQSNPLPGMANFHALPDGVEAMEVGYGLQATPWLRIRPNVQYLHNPGAFVYHHIPDNWTFGLETKIKL
ncbi:carbohydrate porin [Salinisphaera sp. SWV1]|uniref:carbohydrate porin n=1 Tax=Salinisphaera sp. SWV1 TaxID=3454139 RepID=UPI003F83E762